MLLDQLLYRARANFPGHSQVGIVYSYLLGITAAADATGQHQASYTLPKPAMGFIRQWDFISATIATINATNALQLARVQVPGNSGFNAVEIRKTVAGVWYPMVGGVALDTAGLQMYGIPAVDDDNNPDYVWKILGNLLATNDVMTIGARYFDYPA